MIITSNDRPDLDGTACAVAYAELLARTGTAALPVLPGQLDAEARYVLGHLGLRAHSIVPPSFNAVVLVDVSALPGLPSFVDPDAVREVIDHRFHGAPGSVFPNATVQVEAVGAAATLILERFVQAGVVPTENSAVLLQAGIQSNTQCLKGSVTTQRDLDAVACLRGLHPLPEGLLAGQFRARREEILADLDAALLRETKTFDHPAGSFIVSQLECPGARSLVWECASPVARLGRRTMVNLVDPTVPASVLLVPDPEFRAWVADRTGLTFGGAFAHPEVALLRKQIVRRLLAGGQG